MAPQHRPIIEISKQLAWTYLRLQRMLDRCLAGSEASVARVRLLAYVADGPKRSTDIASFFGHAPRTVTEAIDALEAAGHLRRRVIPEDRRVKLVELTPAGREVLDRAQPEYERLLAETVGTLEQSELAGLDAALCKLSQRIEAVEAELTRASDCVGSGGERE